MRHTQKTEMRPNVVMFMLAALSFVAACGGACGGEAPALPPPGCGTSTVWDGESCVPEACGVGRWGLLKVDEDTVYVDAEADDDGDGTVEEPFRSIQEGGDLAGSRGGGLVAVAGTFPGTRYLENVALNSDHEDVTIAGRSLDLVIVDGSGEEEAPVISVEKKVRQTTTVAVSGVTIKVAEGWVCSSAVATPTRQGACFPSPTA